MIPLQSKTVVITGGSLGIGYAVARKCVREGARVILVARGKGDLRRAVRELDRLSNQSHLMYALDVGQWKRVSDFSAWCRDTVGSIHGMVNCAGVYGPIGKLHDLDPVLFEEAVRINLLGTVFMCRALHPLFDAGFRKKIVNFSGGGAAGPFPNYSAYASSKAAIVRFTENVSIEWADQGFDVNCIAPGFVATRLHQQTLESGADAAGDAFFQNTKKQMEQGGVSPEVAADLAAFLLSDSSNGITGKFLSAPWDPWRDPLFQERLRSDKDLATLRRIDEKTFFKVKKYDS
ncbi:MAG TPA: SDR family oxidoreductase [bacterium]